MGVRIERLSEGVLGRRIFPSRFVTECCESNHVHYRNVRLELSDAEFELVGVGFCSGLDVKLAGKHVVFPGKHVELSRCVLPDCESEGRLQVDLMRNIYKPLRYDGAEFFEDDDFIVLRYHNLRVEMSRADFKEFARVVGEANEKV